MLEAIQKVCYFRWSSFGWKSAFQLSRRRSLQPLETNGMTWTGQWASSTWFHLPLGPTSRRGQDSGQALHGAMRSRKPWANSNQHSTRQSIDKEEPNDSKRTNGITTYAQLNDFVRQIWTASGFPALQGGLLLTQFFPSYPFTFLTF